jgi:hypothetical protein
MSAPRIFRRLFAGAALATAVAMTAAAAGATGSVVLSPTAKPLGYSRAAMARALGQFTASGNNPAYFPDTPFQILYADPSSVTQTSQGCGVRFHGTNAFEVTTAAQFFVPVDNVDDSPPVIGTFPTTRTEAESYFYDQSQVGGRGFRVIIDGQATPLGHRYLAGPVRTKKLPDGGGHHIITIGAFIDQLPEGTHTVSITGGVFGAGIQQTYGICFARFEYSYTVNVTEPSS